MSAVTISRRRRREFSPEAVWDGLAARSPRRTATEGKYRAARKFAWCRPRLSGKALAFVRFRFGGGFRPILRRADTHPPLAQRLIHEWRDTKAPLAAGAEEERASFEVLYEREFGFVWRALRHLGVASATLEDAAQEVWLVVHRRLPDFEGRSEPRTWLFGIAMNVARNRRRGQRRTPEMLALPEHVASGRPDPEGQHAGYEAWLKIQRFLDTLDEQRRAVFVCSLLEQLSAAETAEATGLDAASVYHQVRRLRQAFKAYLVGLEQGAP